MTSQNVWTTCKCCKGGPIPSRAKEAKMALCEICYDEFHVERRPEPPTSGVVDWEITDVDYFEQDAFLNICGERLYFQFSLDEGPSLEEAISFIKHDKQ